MTHFIEMNFRCSGIVVEPGVQSAIFNKQEGNKKTGSPPGYMMDPITASLVKLSSEQIALFPMPCTYQAILEYDATYKLLTFLFCWLLPDEDRFGF